MAKSSTITNNGYTYELSNIGPLTTIFTPAAPCLTETYSTDQWQQLGAPTRTDCYPPGFPTPAQQAYYFSPGLCPASYTQNRPLAPWWLGPGETGAECCPSGFSIDTDVFLSCTQYPLSIIGGSTLVTPVRTTLWAPAIAVVWRSGDFISTTVSGPAIITSTDTTSTASTVLPNSAPPLPPTNTAAPLADSPRDVRTIVIATAVPIVVIAMFILAFVVYRRRARRLPIITETSLVELDGNNNNPQNSPTQFWPAPIELPTEPAYAVVLPTSVVTPPPVSPSSPVAVVELPGHSSHQSNPTVSLTAPAANDITFTPAVSSASTPPVVPASATHADAEIQWLERERERVNTRRQRLLKLGELEDEDRQLERRIHEHQSGTSGGM